MITNQNNNTCTVSMNGSKSYGEKKLIYFLKALRAAGCYLAFYYLVVTLVTKLLSCWPILSKYLQ